MKKEFDLLPPSHSDLRPKQTVGIVGCGNFAFSNIAYFLHMEFGRVIGGCMDIVIDRAASLAREYHVPFFTRHFEELLDLPQIDLLYIASNHASHAEYAIAGLERGKSVYIEKPHVVSKGQLVRLVEAMRQNPEQRVTLGFNRPTSRFGELIQRAFSAERGPATYSWFVAGHEIEPDHWYFRPEEGGRVLGNLCHWTDAILRVVGENQYPVSIQTASDPGSDSNIVATYTFADGTLAVLAFSAKGHAFEGVKERFNGHRGCTLAYMDNYRRLTIEVAERKRHYVNLFREHGHRRNITRAYEEQRSALPYDSARQIEYVWNTGMLFLKTREALESGREVTLRSYRESGVPGSGSEMEPQRTAASCKAMAAAVRTPDNDR